MRKLTRILRLLPAVGVYLALLSQQGCRSYEDVYKSCMQEWQEVECPKVAHRNPEVNCSSSVVHVEVGDQVERTLYMWVVPQFCKHPYILQTVRTSPYNQRLPPFTCFPSDPPIFQHAPKCVEAQTNPTYGQAGHTIGVGGTHSGFTGMMNKTAGAAGANVHIPPLMLKNGTHGTHPTGTTGAAAHAHQEEVEQSHTHSYAFSSPGSLISMAKRGFNYVRNSLRAGRMIKNTLAP